VADIVSPAIRPVRLGIIGTGLAVKKLHWPALVRMRNRFVVVAVRQPHAGERRRIRCPRATIDERLHARLSHPASA